MNEEKRAIATVNAATNAIDLIGKQHDEALRQIAEAIRVMLASATELHDGMGNIVGYQVKTGALHRILGYLAGADHPVTIPAVARKTLQLPEPHGNGFDGEVWYRQEPKP